MSNGYRESLIEAEQKSQDSYDKSIISLSGGALGLSIVFIKELVPNATPIMNWSLVVSWCFWAASIAIVVASYFTSRLALRKAIEQADSADYSSRVGGCASAITFGLNICSGLCFVIGIIFLIIFVSNNLG